jgi:twitching motility protein PilT
MPDVDPWLRRLLELKGSDLHLRAGAPAMWRIHGHLAPIPGEPVIDEPRLRHLMRQLLSEERWQRFEQRLDLDFAYALGDEARFRVNYFHQLRGVGCVLRHIPARVQTLRELQAPHVLRDLPHYHNGLVLVTGPTGSGKSTTQAAIVDEINRNYHKHVITIEDPIEFVHQNLGCIITQREVGSDTPEFAQALKDALREDPDVILVGEMRDLETMSLAITLAETGVLIFGTLHTNSAAKTIDRLIDVFPSGRQQQVRTMLAMSLRAIVAQQLLRRADSSGRIAAHEIMISSPAVANMIREGHTEKIPSYIQTGRDQGMILMDTTLRKYLEAKIITGEEAYMFAQEKSQFERFSPHAAAAPPETAATAPERMPTRTAPLPGKPPMPAKRDGTMVAPAKALSPNGGTAVKPAPAVRDKPGIAEKPVTDKPAKLPPSQEGWG